MPENPLRVTLLLSGGGTTFAAIERWSRQASAGFVVTDVISDQPDAYGLERAREAGCRTHVVDYRAFDSRDDFDRHLRLTTADTQPELVVLAGFMRIVNPDFVRTFEGKLLNIHPSLLPAYPGLNTYKRVLDAGDHTHGTTVHFVNDVLDGGPLIAQALVAVKPGDTEATLAGRVQAAERTLYPQVISWFAHGRLTLQGSDIQLDGRRLESPLQGSVDPVTLEYVHHDAA